jgi:hypothetical protein
MKIPKGYNRPGISEKTHALKLLKNLYGQKQAGCVWHQHLVSNLIKHGFKQSKVDECILYYKRCVFMVYVDDAIIMGPDDAELDEMFALLKKDFNVEEEGDGTLGDYLGIRINQKKDGSITLSQPLDKPNSKVADIPHLSTKIITKDSAGKQHDNNEFDYRSVIRKLNFLEKSTRPNIAEAVHQCARYCSNPKQSHAEAVKFIGRYLRGTSEQGLIFKPSIKDEVFQCWVYASHAGEWNQKEAMNDPDTAHSRSVYVCKLLNTLVIKIAN